MMDEQPVEIDGELMLDVVTTMTDNARRVAVTAVESARAAGDDDLSVAVSAALARETEAIVSGCPSENRALIGAVRAAGHAIASVAAQALRTGVDEPQVSLTRAFDLFESYVQGPGRGRIVATSVNAQASDR